MKNILLIIALFAFTANAQVTSSCDVPPQLDAAYHKDAVQLATNYLDQAQGPDTIYVHPPQYLMDDIKGGLAAIVNSGLPEADSVFNLYCVHNINGFPGDYA